MEVPAFLQECERRLAEEYSRFWERFLKMFSVVCVGRLKGVGDCRQEKLRGFGCLRLGGRQSRGHYIDQNERCALPLLYPMYRRCDAYLEPSTRKALVGTVERCLVARCD